MKSNVCVVPGYVFGITYFCFRVFCFRQTRPSPHLSLPLPVDLMRAINGLLIASQSQRILNYFLRTFVYLHSNIERNVLELSILVNHYTSFIR